MTTSEEHIKEEFKSKVYNALSEVAYEFADINNELHKEAMEEAIEFFMIQFYEEV